MKTQFKKIKLKFVAGIVAIIGAFGLALPVGAISNGLGVSPMYQKIVVNPGEEQSVAFRISNPADSKTTMYYSLSVEPFYLDEQGSAVYTAEGEMSEIVNWVSFDVPERGKIEPNGVEDIVFTVDVPESAPAGGQYFTVIVTEESKAEAEGGESGEDERSATIKETYRMAHLVYAEVTGEVVRSGTIEDVNLPSFLLSGNITGSATIKNTGNVHSDASYVLQVFPLFSDEEVYSNEEDPETVMILPNRSVYHETSWGETPTIGIFNVTYTVRFGDSMEQISKMVIVCPAWLLFIIIFVIVAVIIWIVTRARSRGKKVRRERVSEGREE